MTLDIFANPGSVPVDSFCRQPEVLLVFHLMATGLLVLGNQLFDPQLLSSLEIDCVFMREDYELCTYFKFHQLKVYFFLAAMRHYADELRKHGLRVTYQEIDGTTTSAEEKYEDHLLRWLKKQKINKLVFYEVEDKFFEKRLLKALSKMEIATEILPSPMFLTTHTQFKEYLKKSRRPFMKTFYEGQRRRLNILMQSDGQPVGGSWSFDELNRKPLPKNLQPPEPQLATTKPKSQSSNRDLELLSLCRQLFPDHPGTSSSIWFPVDRLGAQAWLADFLAHRLDDFGPYEDALTDKSDFVYHSALSVFLNCGLLTPAEVVKAVVAAGKKRKIPIESLEGFIRQMIGWREFIRGIYANFSDEQEQRNFWGHQRKLKECWYNATTGVEPLDQVIRKAQKLGYAHHIERLMVVGNLMLLLEVHPQEAHRWFMEMFIDSSDWVMGPNVYGMGIFSDGGVFATKPYICGSNYYRKMGGYKAAPWCDAVDGLYWGFIEKNKGFFKKNPRLSMMVSTVAKMDAEKKARIYSAAELLKARLTE